MSRREAWLSAAAIFGLALVVRTVAAASLAFPIPEDTTYYSAVARNLVEGRGLVSDAIWSYQTPPLVLPRPAFEVWLPLPTLLAAVPIWIAGAANWFRAAQVFSVLTGAVVAALAWRLGADVAAEMRLPVGRARTLAVGSGAVASVLGPLVVYSALADSTALFAALSLGACLLMTRLSGLAAGAARPAGTTRPTASSGPAAGASGLTLRLRALARGLQALDRRLLALGLIFGLAALTRSEAMWLGLAWLVVVWRWTPGSFRERLPLVLVPAAIAAFVYAPWAVRDWAVFGTPLPGQTLANALSVNGHDVFAYLDQPTLSRYLAQGPAALLGMRVTGTVHNFLNVLVIQAFPVGAIGLLALPWTGRLQAVRPLLLTAAATFLAASLIFPVSTLWGTFLHAAGAIYVLLAVSCLVALDAGIAWIGRLRHWTRPVAWLGPALAVAVTVPLMVVSMRSLDRGAGKVQAAYAELPAAMARAGVPLSGAGPVISDHPIWLTESAGVPALALPEESPEAVLDLAHRFGATLLVVQTDANREWPGILDGGSTAAQCFRPVPLTDNSGESPADDAPLGQFRVFRIACP